ncbi:MAG: glycine zipper 2TM domain-containing protein [Deltaproteobacteria bacterium]|nr:glycine zipper 2TM domain-containing protein [Deltaproteobacteria bacterium]
MGCAGPGYNTQKGAAIGAAYGALMGQVIGRNTAGTLIGAGVGTLVGSIIGNAVDQDEQQRREAGWATRSTAYAYPQSEYSLGSRRVTTYETTTTTYDAQPSLARSSGKWITVPGQWIEGRWVPSHKLWVAGNP